MSFLICFLGITNYTLSTLDNKDSADIEPTLDEDAPTTGKPKKKLNKRKTKFVVMT